MARKIKKIKPWQQGELDGLCGIYAIVNAIAAIMPPEYNKSRKPSEELFQALVTRANTLYGVHNTLRTGLNTEELIPLIQFAQKYMRTYHTVDGMSAQIRADRPLLRVRSRNIKIVTEVLRASLVKPNVALILGLDGIFHWTAATKITEKVIHLHDSDKMTRISLSKCSVGAGKKYHFSKPGTFRLTLKVAS